MQEPLLSRLPYRTFFQKWLLDFQSEPNLKRFENALRAPSASIAEGSTPVSPASNSALASPLRNSWVPGSSFRSASHRGVGLDRSILTKALSRGHDHSLSPFAAFDQRESTPARRYLLLIASDFSAVCLEDETVDPPRLPRGPFATTPPASAPTRACPSAPSQGTPIRCVTFGEHKRHASQGEGR